MNIQIDASLAKPVYLQIYEQLRRDIVGGVYAYGTKIPSKRLLAEEIGVSLITAEHAYALLADEGYIEPRQRSGYFVSFRDADAFPTPVSTAAPVRAPLPSASEIDFPFSVFAKTMRRVLSEYDEKLLVKCPNAGCTELRETISRYLARSRGIHVRGEQIVIGSGAEYLYGLIVQMLGRDRVYAIEKPSYAKIEQVYRANGTVCELLPLGQDGIASDALAASGASVLHITPYRSFPSGVTASVSKRREYLRFAEGDDRYIVEDDVESEFTPAAKPAETVFAMATKENVVYVNSFSRTIAPSIRIAYMVLPERLLPRFRERVGFYSCTVPTFEQYVLAEFIASGDFERHINRVRRKIRRGN